MARLHLPLFVALALLASACARTTVVESSEPLEIRARPPAPPPPELAAVEQPPPPPPRVVLEGELVRLDEVIGFATADQSLDPESSDIVDALATWLLAQPSGVLAIEVHTEGKASRKQHATRSKAIAKTLADALVARGVAPERVRASGLGKSPDEQFHLVIRFIREEAKP